jgi:gamma-tubulin complex component 2
MVMSSSSTARVLSRAERRTANDNSSTQPRAPSGQSGSRGERLDPRRTESPQPSASGVNHKRTASGSQRTNKGVEERRTERVQVTTRETLTTRTRSPDRRSAPSAQPPERQRPAESSRAYSGDPRPKSSKAEAPPQGQAQSHERSSSARL